MFPLSLTKNLVEEINALCDLLELSDIILKEYGLEKLSTRHSFLKSTARRTMDTLGFGIQMRLIAMIVMIPIVFVKKGYGFFRVNLISIPLIFLFIIMAAY